MLDQVKRVLIIEDSDTWRKLLRIHVGRIAEDAEVAEANSLERGLQALSRGTWDLVLLDLGLPGYSPTRADALHRLMDLHPRQATVVVSGSSDVDSTGVHLDLLSIGPCDAVSKAELSTEVLESAIRHALQRAARLSGTEFPALGNLDAVLDDNRVHPLNGTDE